MKQAEIIAHGLADCFKDAPHKIALWLLTKNPHFGELSPAELIAMRGEVGLRKVANFVLEARWGMEPAPKDGGE
jgi:hypothetical protein